LAALGLRSSQGGWVAPWPAGCMYKLCPVPSRASNTVPATLTSDKTKVHFWGHLFAGLCSSRSHLQVAGGGLGQHWQCFPTLFVPTFCSNTCNLFWRQFPRRGMCEAVIRSCKKTFN
jgi:hypothetical protein